jgi:twitching motility protein PilT
MPVNFVTILKAARRENASDIHLIAGLPPAFRVSGEIILANSDKLSREDCCTMTYGLLNEEQKKHLVEQKELCFSMEDATAGRLRVTVYFQNNSPEMAIRLCALEMKSAEELHLPPIIDDFARKPNGLVLITGPTGVGKTTTLNYMIDLINRERRCKIVTIEDPIEYVHQRKKALIVQQEVHTDCISFSRALRHVLRQDPDIIVIGEMRDMETISTALTAAETGHLVMATLHTPNVSQAVERIVGVFSSEQQQQIVLQLANCLQGVVAQDLLPVAGGKGLTLAFEIMVVTVGIRNMIRENNIHQIYSAIQIGKKDGMSTMDQNLLDLYQQGKITYDVAVSKARSTEMFNRQHKKQVEW